MAGTALQNFTDFVKLTGPAYYSSPDKFLNEAVKTAYSLSKFLKGKGNDKTIQSGENIKDDVMFDEARTFQNYQPNAEFTWTQPQVATEQSIEWRFSIDHMSWTDHEITLNMNSGFSKEYATVQYKKLRKKIEQRMWTSITNGMEEKLWAGQTSTAGTHAQMEATDGSEQYSLLSMITENTTDYHCANGSWVTIEGIDPANESKWRNQTSLYDYNDPGDSDSDSDGLIDAFDSMLTNTGFEAPEFHKEHFEESGTGDHNKQYIFCSNGGLNLYKRLLRASNDLLIQRQDASYPTPKFDGIPLSRVAYLSSVSHTWGTNTTAATETAYATAGYRYFWVDCNYITPVFHNERYFYKKDPFFLEKQPYTWVCPVDVWWNVFCNSRQRQGVVAPGA